MAMSMRTTLLDKLPDDLGSAVAGGLSAVTERAGEAAGMASVAGERIGTVSDQASTALRQRRQEAATRLAKKEKKLEKKLRRQHKQATKALSAKQERAGRVLRTKRKAAKQAARSKGERLKSVGGETGAKLSGAIALSKSRGGRSAQGVGIDRLLGDIQTGRFEKMMSALTAAGAAITAVEIWTEHDGASFGNKMMWLPVLILPTAVPLGIASVFSKKVAKTALPICSVVIIANGVQGVYFHWRGIIQKPGGLRQNARYNVEMGPPALAPLLASMVGGMGLLAAILRREDDPA